MCESTGRSAKSILTLAVMISFAIVSARAQQENPRAWMQNARIGAYGLRSDNAAEIVHQAEASGVYGIEVDNDITGRYRSFVDPDAKLEAIRKVATLAHKRGNHAFVYISGFECITGNADSSPHSLAKDHPDWLQRKRDGQPAVFHAGIAFWVRKGDEDAWVTPYAPGWRNIYMERVRQIAATGIDGIYVDIPYWKTDYTGWEQSWASFDKYTVAAFRKQTGLDAMDEKQVKIGDFNDPGFRKWIDFRMQSITDFLADVRKNAISVNPKIAVIPEIWPGIEESAVRVGADVYQIYPVVDAIAHEYEFGDGDDHTAASRGIYDWFMYQIGMQSFRAFAESKPTWMLNYSWDGNPRVKAGDAMKNLAMSELMAGANFWDAPGHVMAGSNDMDVRIEIFRWIAKNQKQLSSQRTPVGTVCVYFSEKTRNDYADEYVPSYQGILLLLLRQHIQFQIVTPRTLSSFQGNTLVLPDVRVLDTVELRELRRFGSTGGTLVTTGASDHRIAALPGVMSFPDAPGKKYMELARNGFDSVSAETDSSLLKALKNDSAYPVEASPDMAVYVAKVNRQTHWYLANFEGLKKGAATKPVTQHNVILYAPIKNGVTLHVLPFLGAPHVLQGTSSGNRVKFVIPKVDRGAVAWTEH